MRTERQLRWLLIGLAAATSAACGSGVTGPLGEPNYVSLQSDPGDFIGGGLAYRYTQEDAVISVSASGNTLLVGITGDESWSGVFEESSDLTRLESGSYSDLQRYPFNDPLKGGLTWFGEARACNALSGSFIISSVSYNRGNLSAVDLQFEQHCENGIPALRGTIHWRSDDPTHPQGPAPIPATLWRPAQTPTGSNWVRLEDDQGDWLGGGVWATYAPPDTPITLVNWDAKFTVSVGEWSGGFVAMNAIDKLERGYYPDLRAPLKNPVRGSFQLSGSTRGCNIITSWVAIDNAVYVNGNLTALDVRFEEHCEGGAPALHGMIRWRR